MKDFLALTRPFTLEVLVCLIMVLSMAVGVVCVGGYRLVVALSGLLATWSKTSWPSSHRTASTPQWIEPQRLSVKGREARYEMQALSQPDGLGSVHRPSTKDLLWAFAWRV